MISQFIHLSGRQLPPPHLQKETTPPPLTSAYLGPESSVLLLRRKWFWGAEVCQGLTWRKAVAPGRGLVKPQVLEDNTSPPCSWGWEGAPHWPPAFGQLCSPTQNKHSWMCSQNYHSCKPLVGWAGLLGQKKNKWGPSPWALKGTSKLFFWGGGRESVKGGAIKRCQVYPMY